MAFDCFLKINGIDGECTDHKHQKWIEVQSFNWGISQRAAVSVSSHGSLTSERADFADFGVTKHLDAASPALALGCASGKHFASAQLQLHRAGETKELFMEYKFTDVVVSGYAPGGHSGGDLPMEAVSLRYGKVEWNYIPTKVAGGKGSGNIPGGWDLKSNQKV